MKKIIFLSLATLTMGTIAIFPAQANNSQVDRFCAEYGDLTDTEDIKAAVQNYIGEIEDITTDDLIALTNVVQEVESGKNLSNICNN